MNRARSSSRLIVVVLCLGTATFSMVQSVVSPILSTLQRDLHTTQGTVTWVLTAYLLSAAVFTPILGRIGDMAGKERIFVLVMIIFGLGSVLAALAPNIEVMIAARAIQGVGGAVLPLSFGIIRDELPPERVAGAVGLTSAVLGAGGGLATVLAGPIVNVLNYHWLFWIPLIVVGLSAVLGYRFIPESTVREDGHIDWGSAALLAGWLVAFLLGVSEAPRWGWLSAPVLGLIALSGLLALAWAASERRAANPVIDLALLRIPILWRINVVGLLYGAAIYSNFAFLPEFAQTPRSTGYGFGASITHSGLIMLPAPVLAFLFGNLASPIARRIGAKWVVVLGSALMIPSYGVLLLPGHHETYLYIASGCLGAGYGLGFTINSNIILAAVPRAQSGVANGMHANIRTIGGAIFAAIVSSLITSHLQADGYPRSIDYNIGWALLVGACVVATAVSLALPRVRLDVPVVVAPPEPLDATDARVVERIA